MSGLLADEGLTLVLGGARSGKSAWVVDRAGELGERVLVVATAEALDDDMRERIREHRRERPQGWDTLEEPRRVAERLDGLHGGYHTVVLDCLTLLVSNWMLDGSASDEPLEAASIDERIDELVGALRRRGRRVIVISNEVGAGIVPDNRIARRFRDLLGRANQSVARQADAVVLMVAGIPMMVKKGR